MTDAHPAPRRAQVVLSRADLHEMLGLQADEFVSGLAYNPLAGCVQVVVDSPRLPAMDMQPTRRDGPLRWAEPPVISRFVSEHYEDAVAA